MRPWKMFLPLAMLLSLAPVRVLANGETTSPNMDLTIPAVGITTGPDWATDVNASLNIIDGHNHCTGSGVQVPPCGININSDLTFLGNNATSVNSVVFGTNTSASNLGIYSNGTDLFYKDASGTAIQITKSHGVNVSAGNIQNLPSTPTGGAGISWQNSQGTFQLTKDSGAAGGNLDAGTLVFRYGGSYPTPSGNYIAFQAPSGLATGYAFTFPATLAAANNSFAVSSTAGAISYVTADNSTLEVSSTTLRIKDLGVAAAKIANATITGTQVANNINLPGKTVQEASKNVVVSNTNATNSLAIVRGIVSSAGTIVDGEGYSVVRNSTGVFTISFTTAFGDQPAVTALIDSTSATTNLWASTQTIQTTSVVIVIVDSTNTAANSTFSFIAIGQRS